MSIEPTAHRLRDKVAIVTGGATGIGRATAELFARHGANVAVIYASNQAAAAETVALIRAAGGTAIAVQADVSRAADVAAMVEQTAAELGPVTILVNNAGIMPEGTALTTSAETWRRVIDVNLTSMYLIARAVVPQMQGRGGSIINMASVQGLRGHPNRLAYVTSKHGILGLTKALAADHARDGIRVNAICPGTIDTPMLRRELEKVPEGERDALLQSYRDLHPLGIIGEPIDIAYAALFLASDESRFMTGAELVVDGGYTSLIVHE